MKIFKAEQWNMDILLPLFERYRMSYGMKENPERTLAFLHNRIRFSESVIFIAIKERQEAEEQNNMVETQFEEAEALGFIQLYPRLSSLQLQRYWQVTDIFVQQHPNHNDIFNALIEKSKEFVHFTQSHYLIVEQNPTQHEMWERNGFRLNSKKTIFELML